MTQRYELEHKYEVWQIYKLDALPQMIYQVRYFYKNILSAQIELHNIDYVLMLLNEFRKSFTKSVVEFPQKTNPNVKPINPSELEALVKAFETNQSVV